MSKVKLSQTSWFETRQGMLIVGLLSLLIAYIIASRAIDTGSWQQYGLTVLLLIVGIHQVIHFFRKR
jgi:hypothetical protein